MKIDPYSKHDTELVELLAECLDILDPEVQKDYLINILTSPSFKNKTIKEVLEAEVKAKRSFE